MWMATGGQAGPVNDGRGRAKQIVIASVSQPHPAHPNPRHGALVFCASLARAFSAFPLVCPLLSLLSIHKYNLDTIVNQKISGRDIDCSKGRFPSGIDIEIKTTVLSHPLVPLGTVFRPYWILSCFAALSIITHDFLSSARLASRTFTTTRCAARQSSHWLQHRCWLSPHPNNNNNRTRTHR